jgi:hypothetical protein
MGVIASKNVGSVSVSYDTNAGIVKDAGHWNLTAFGTRFIWLANMVGTGGIEIGSLGNAIDMNISTTGITSAGFGWPVF